MCMHDFKVCLLVCVCLVGDINLITQCGDPQSCFVSLCGFVSTLELGWQLFKSTKTLNALV